MKQLVRYRLKVEAVSFIYLDFSKTVCTALCDVHRNDIGISRQDSEACIMDKSKNS